MMDAKTNVEPHSTMSSLRKKYRTIYLAFLLLLVQRVFLENRWVLHLRSITQQEEEEAIQIREQTNRTNRLLLGIHCPDESWQQSIRETYLQFYNTTGKRLGLSPRTICPWRDQDGPESWNQHDNEDDCRIFYKFFHADHDTMCQDPPVDSVHLSSRTKECDGSKTTPFLQISWFQWAHEQISLSIRNTHAGSKYDDFEWKIGYAECGAMLQPPLLIDSLDQQQYQRDLSSPSTPVSNAFATTDFIDQELMCQSNGTTTTNSRLIRTQEEYAKICGQPAQARVYWLAHTLIPTLLKTNFRLSLNSSDLQVDLYIRETIETYLRQQHLPSPHVLLKIPRIEKSSWQKEWDNLLNLITKQQPPTPFLWKNLPVFHLTGKYGFSPDVQRDSVLQRRREFLWNYSWPSTHLATYHDFPQWILDDPTWERHVQFRLLGSPDHPTVRGAGFWFWKAPILQYHLRQLQQNPLVPGEDSFVIYTDLDIVEHLEWFPTFFETFQKGGYDVGIFQLPYPEVHYTSGLVLHEYCSHMENMMERSQYTSNFLLLRNNGVVRNLIDDWTTASARYDLISGVRDPAFPEPSGFKDHRHDQSFMSVLLHCKYVNSTENYNEQGAFKGFPGNRKMRMLKLNNDLPTTGSSLDSRGNNETTSSWRI